MTSTSSGPPAASGEEDLAEAIRHQLARRGHAIECDRALLRQELRLDRTEAVALVHVAQVGECTPHHLAAHLGMSSGGVTALIQRLQSRGHLRRRPHPRDRRSVLLSATPRTAQRLHAAIEPLTAATDEVTRQLDRNDAHMVLAYLAEIADVAEYTVARLETEAVERCSLAVLPQPDLWA
jgi:DNA-binding MarR family transcriptional regulator